jgi:dihydroorotate dehydrogenase
MYRRVDGSIPLIGIGGVSSGDDAYIKIRAGASLVQIYTALIYRGPSLISQIKSRLAARITADGFDNISSVVGVDASDY